MIAKVLLTTLKAIAMSLVSEAVLKHFIIWALEKLAERSSNTVDDEIVEMVKKAVYSPEEFEKQKKIEKPEEPKKEE